jgi:uncharacterized protein
MSQKANIDYPTEWIYKIIGQSETHITEAIQTCCGDREHSLKASRQSSAGRFISMELKICVESYEDRESLFHSLFKQNGIKMVL